MWIYKENDYSSFDVGCWTISQTLDFNFEFIVWAMSFEYLFVLQFMYIE
jgi:hypothetical protein